MVIKGVRKAWSPIQVRVDVREATYPSARAPFVDASPRLASAFYLANVRTHGTLVGFIEKVGTMVSG